MPPKTRPSLTLVHAQDSPENTMFRANKRLSEGQPKEAIKLYTKILYKLSPGHVCALLNRSLAYLCLNMPELAVFDAYRAGILANQMRGDENHGLSKYQAAAKFLRAERLAVDGEEVWTSERRRFVQGGWAYTALTTIVINDVPELEGPTAIECLRFSTNKRQIVCMALEVRAIFRLCGALYMCGGGARSDALGLIDDAHKRCTVMVDWEKTYFQMLGSEILDDCMEPWDEGINDPQGLGFLSLTEQRRRGKERRQTKESMLAKTAKLEVSRYPRNIHEPELDNAEWQKLLWSWVQQTTTNCSPHFIIPDDIWDEKSKSYVELRADRDIKAGELVLSERTRSNVTTSIPEDIFENPNPPPSRRYYCDTCSCLLIVPRDCATTYEGSTVPIPALPPSSPSPTISPSSQASANGAYGSDENSDATTDPITFSQPDPTETPTPILPPDTPSPTSTPPDLTFCAPTHPLPTCSPHCRSLRSPFDTPLHSTSLERDLRTSHLQPPAIPKPLRQRKRQCLIDLLLLRTLAVAIATDTHPLLDRDLLFADCGAGCRTSTDEENWSFTNNIIRPLHTLSRLLEHQGTDQWGELEWCDGWVLSTLISKIENAMDVSRSPNYAKIFNRDGNAVKTICRGERGWDDLVSQTEDEDEEEWSGSIHPIFNMIRVADPMRGERPNVRVERREGVRCFALRGIRAGDVLVRAGDRDALFHERNELVLE